MPQCIDIISGYYQSKTEPASSTEYVKDQVCLASFKPMLPFYTS